MPYISMRPHLVPIYARLGFNAPAWQEGSKTHHELNASCNLQHHCHHHTVHDLLRFIDWFSIEDGSKVVLSNVIERAKWSEQMSERCIILCMYGSHDYAAAAGLISLFHYRHVRDWILCGCLGVDAMGSSIKYLSARCWKVVVCVCSAAIFSISSKPAGGRVVRIVVSVIDK